MPAAPLNYSDPIRERLEPGEVAHWTGQPRQGFLFRGADFAMIPFSLLWGWFAIFWVITAFTSTRRIGRAFRPFTFIFPLWVIPFVLIGLYFIVGRFFVDAYVRRKTWYALTDRRAIIVTGHFSRTTVSVPLATLPQIDLTEHRDGTGTIIFGQAMGFSPYNRGGRPFGVGGPFGGAGYRQGAVPAFDHIAGAADVYRLAQQLRYPPAATAPQT